MTTVDGKGRPAMFRYYLAFERDRVRAIALVRQHLTVLPNEHVEALNPVTESELLRRGMKPANIKQCV